MLYIKYNKTEKEPFTQNILQVDPETFVHLENLPVIPFPEAEVHESIINASPP